MEQWALASSQESLPRVIIDELQKSEQIHWHRIDSATKEIDNSDNPITEWEIMNALKRGKSTAPGDDGVTYDIINALAEVRGNPLYFLINRSYLTRNISNKFETSCNYTKTKA